MNFEEIFRDFWWLMFPIFGMGFALVGMFQTDNRNQQVLRLIKSYVDQGKDPPPELLKLASEPSDYDMNVNVQSPRQPQNRVWTFFIFLALAVGNGVGYWYSRGEGYEFAFLVVGAVMGVLAIGSLIILLISRRP